MCDLSIVIVSWNTRDLLSDCLRSVYGALTASPELSAEVWVVDNASNDGSAAMVREQFPEVRCLANAENVGFAWANNQALRRAKGRYWLLLNPDTIVPPCALTALVWVLEAQPDADACGPLLLNADGTLQPSWARFPGLISEWTGHLDRSQSPYAREELSDPAPGAVPKPFPVDWVGGACLLLRAEALQKVGLLDEGFFLYGEEVELCHRLGKSGGKTLFVPGVAVTHLGGQSSRAVPEETRRRLFQSSVRLYRRLYGGCTPRAILASGIAMGRYALSGLRRRKHG